MAPKKKLKSTEKRFPRPLTGHVYEVETQPGPPESGGRGGSRRRRRLDAEHVLPRRKQETAAAGR